MESAFSETRRAAKLLQQFSGFSFLSGQYTALTPFCFRSAMHHRPFLPRFTCAAFVSALARSAALRSVAAYFPGEYLLW